MAPRAALSAACLAVAVLAGLASTAPAQERRTVVAGAKYRAGGFIRFWLGADYRDVWATPVSVEVLDLAREAGGLRPVRRIGGQQTKGLALAGADGRSYTFRGLEKDSSHLLDAVDPELKNTVVAKMLDMLMAAQHPASELVACGLLEPAGVPCPPWRLVVLPDDPALGQFREDLAGAVGVFAPYPQAERDGVPGFLGATEIVDHLEMYRRLEAGEAEVDADALLRARLLDVLMGDWDRHRKQWRWARVPGKARFVPIPEDRDQAFSRYEGFALDRARGTDPRFQEFGPRYAGIGGLTYNGAEQDRQLLVGFTREDFVAAAKSIQAALTDEAIEAAVRRMPPEWYALDGARLVRDLLSRRDSLHEAAARYHEHLAGVVDVRLTKLDERVEAVRRPNGDLEVSVHVIGKDAQSGRRTFHRVFDADETKEVRFYTAGGNDVVEVTGEGKGPLVRMIGGPGDDTLDAAGSDRARMSDAEGRNQALGASLDSRPYEPPPPPKNAPWIPPRDFTRETYGMPWVSWSGDLGLFLGYGIETQSFGFRRAPYANGHRVRAGWAFGQGSARLDYQGIFHRENRGSHFGLSAFASGVEVLRFYGFGNDIEAPGDQDFYKASANQFLVHPSFRVPFRGKGLLSVGPALKYTRDEGEDDQFIDEAKPYGWGDFGELALHGVLSWDARDNLVFPRRGLFAAVRGTWFPALWDVEDDFGQVNGNVNAYASAGRVATLAARVGGKKVFGPYPYLEAASIGGGGLGAGALAEPEDTVRGFRARRYLGDASLWANASLRLRVSHITLVVPGHWGVEGFADAGRVWLDGESSDTWHSGVGGGVWLSLLSDRMAFSAGLAHSSQDDIFYFTGGFTY